MVVATVERLAVEALVGRQVLQTGFRLFRDHESRGLVGPLLGIYHTQPTSELLLTDAPLRSPVPYVGIDTVLYHDLIRLLASELAPENFPYLWNSLPSIPSYHFQQSKIQTHPR
jgi:hypothetical protein